MMRAKDVDWFKVKRRLQTSNGGVCVSAETFSLLANRLQVEDFLRASEHLDASSGLDGRRGGGHWLILPPPTKNSDFWRQHSE
jgi:hypothetical protein